MDKFLKRKADSVEAPVITPTVKKAKSGSKKAGKIDGKTVEQHRRALGDLVKRNISVEKWCIGARTSIETNTSLAVFEALVVPNATSVTPSNFGPSTPVVVVAVQSREDLGEIFGHSKIKGGTRMGSWTADKADIIFFPPTGEMRVWWTMR